MAMVRGGRHLGDRAFFPSMPSVGDNLEVLTAEVLEAFLSQTYVDRPIPPVLIVNQDLDAPELMLALCEQAGRKIILLRQPQGERRKWLDMTVTNARMALERRLAERGTAQLRTQALVDVLALHDVQDTLRIECFDVSHTAGEATQASCVVYAQHAMQSREYRRYNIEDITPGDDYAAMRQALLRRYGGVVSHQSAAPRRLCHA
jgi:excinuclease ABC subunit C